MSALVRAATTDDRAELAPLLWPPLVAEPKRRRFLRGLDEGDVLVVLDDGAIAAYAWTNEYFFGHTFLAYLGVAAEYRRRGHAGLLLAAVERRAVTDRVFTSTNRSNDPMRAVLDRHGWRHCGTIDELDPGDPELVFVKFPAGEARGAPTLGAG